MSEKTRTPARKPEPDVDDELDRSDTDDAEAAYDRDREAREADVPLPFTEDAIEGQSEK